MSEERLKEIKFSINLRINCYKEKDVNYLFANEALELYNEVIRLKEENNQLDDIRNANYLSWQDSVARIKRAIEYIQNHQLVFELSSLVQIKEWFDMFYKDTLNILRGEYK